MNRPDRMQALVAEDWGAPASLVMRDLPVPMPGEGELSLRVAAVGLGFPDVLLIGGRYQIKPPLPVIPGGEIAGTVEAVGNGVDPSLVGKRIVALTDHGGLAQVAIASAASAVPIPSDLGFSGAAVAGMGYGTAWQGLRMRAGLQAGETLLVRGAAGGVGRAAVEIGRHLGARVIAIASTEEKRAVALEAGAQVALPHSDNMKAIILEITKGAGADVVFDLVGDPGFRPECLSTVGRGGRILIVGFAGGKVPEIPAHYVINKFCSIIGVAMGGFLAAIDPAGYRTVMAEALSLVSDRAVRPMISEYHTLPRAREALAAIAERRIVGRAVVIPEQETEGRAMHEH